CSSDLGAGIVEEVVEGPGGQGVDLDQSVLLVEGDQRCVDPRRRLVPADSGEPEFVPGKRLLQRRDLAAGAAQTGIAGEEFGPEVGVLLGHRLLRGDVDGGDGDLPRRPGAWGEGLRGWTGGCP